MARNKMIIEIEEASDDGQKVAIKLHGISWADLCAKFNKAPKSMSLCEVSAHYMISKYMEFHQQRALLTAEHKGIIIPARTAKAH